MLILGGTFQPRSPWYFQRSTSMARLLKVNDQMTPKAYASPRVMTLPRLAMMVNIWRMKTRLTMRWLVPNRGCGLRNQSVSTPSSATRISTPVEPIIEVLMAPERIRKPTSTTKMRKAMRQNMRADHVHGQAGDQVVLIDLRPRPSGISMEASSVAPPVKTRL